MSGKPAGAVVMGHVRIELQGDLELFPRASVIFLLEIGGCQIGMIRSRCLVQLDGLRVVGDSGCKPAIDIFHRAEVVPRHGVFLNLTARSK